MTLGVCIFLSSLCVAVAVVAVVVFLIMKRKWQDSESKKLDELWLERKKKEEEDERKFKADIPATIFFDIPPEKRDTFYEIMERTSKKDAYNAQIYDRYKFWSAIVKLCPEVENNEEVKKWNTKSPKNYVSYGYNANNMMKPVIIVTFEKQR